MPSPERPSRRAGGIGLLVVLALLVLAFAVSRGTDDPLEESATSTTADFSPRTPTTTSPAETSVSVPGARVQVTQPGWTSLGSPGLGAIDEPIVVDAGNMILVWGGTVDQGRSTSAGGSYQPGVWRDLPDVEVPSAADAIGVWTGSDLVVSAGALVAWNPVSNTWNPVVDPSTGAEVDVGRPIAATMTDDAVVLIHGSNEEARGGGVSTLALSRNLDCCTRYPDPPFRVTAATAVWTGDEVLLVGIDAGGGVGSSPSARLAALDPDEGRWEELEPPPFTVETAIAAAWVDGGLVTVSDGGAAATWTRPDGWTQLPDLPDHGEQCQRHLLGTSEGVLATGCGELAVFSPEARRWVGVVAPEPGTGWDEDAVCTPTLRNADRRTVYLWCASDGGSPSFWRLDMPEYEASTYGEAMDNGEPWSIFPNPALGTDGTLIWSGSELLTVCGSDTGRRCPGSGWGLAPDTGVYHRLPSTTSGAGSRQSVVWIGDELLVVRGLTTAYDPFSIEWRTTTRGPIAARAASALWTGSEVIFYGNDREASATGVTYQPDGGTWSNMAGAPLEPALDPVIAWSGEEMYVFGGWIFSDEGIAPYQRGAAYNPATNEWRPLPPLPGDGVGTRPGVRLLSGHAGAFVDGRFVVIGTNLAGIAREGVFANEPFRAGFVYDPATNRWTEMTPPRDPFRDSANPSAPSLSATAHGAELAVSFADESGGAIGFYRPATDTWRYVDGVPGDGNAPALVSGTFADGDGFIAYLSAAGTVVLHDAGQP